MLKGTDFSYASIAYKSPIYKLVKRFFDIFLSLVGVLVLSPLFLIISIAIIIEDGFPAIFVQDRNGLHGRVFRMYKFRTMCKNAPEMHKDLLKNNEMTGPAFKMKNDPRVTRVGRILRHTSLDELPQLINIIKGDMSIVGPRPLPTYETKECTEYQKQRLLVKPGLTCYWQCSGRNDIDFEEWIEMDLQYIKDMSLLTDLRIMWKTFSAVAKNDGAY